MHTRTITIPFVTVLVLSSCSSVKQWGEYNRNDLADLSYRDLMPNKLNVVEVDPTKLQPLLLAGERNNKISFSNLTVHDDRGPSPRTESDGTPTINVPEEELDLSLLEAALPTPTPEVQVEE